jgi:uncharacterized damage-inducible protein DinB
MGNGLLQSWHHEHASTLKAIRAAPAAKVGWRPHEKSRTLGELCWHLAEAERFFVVKGLGVEVPGPNLVPKETPPATPAAMADAFGKSHAAMAALLDARSPAWFGETVEFFGMKMTRLAVLELMIRHEAHHRGQLSVYLRLAGAKVPSIYGGTADEPM